MQSVQGVAVPPRFNRPPPRAGEIAADGAVGQGQVGRAGIGQAAAGPAVDVAVISAALLVVGGVAGEGCSR